MDKEEYDLLVDYDDYVELDVTEVNNNDPVSKTNNDDFVIVDKNTPKLHKDMCDYLNSYSGYPISDKNNNVIVLPTQIGKIVWNIDKILKQYNYKK